MDLKKSAVISLIATDFEDLEFWYPTLRLQEAGARVDIVGPNAEHTYVGKYGLPATTTHSFVELSTEGYDILLVPGGWAPDKLRRHPDVLRIVQEMNSEGKIIGQICHAGWVLASAGILRGKRVTSTPGIKDDLTNAGATWVDEPVVVDGNLVSSRRPADLPAYLAALIDLAASR